MPHAVEVVARPFAAFFEEAFSARRCFTVPRAEVVGTARLPSHDGAGEDRLRLDLCCECLRPNDECCCD
jgi:hypothetical protein